MKKIIIALFLLLPFLVGFTSVDVEQTSTIFEVQQIYDGMEEQGFYKIQVTIINPVEVQEILKIELNDNTDNNIILLPLNDITYTAYTRALEGGLTIEDYTIEIQYVSENLGGHSSNVELDVPTFYTGAVNREDFMFYVEDFEEHFVLDFNRTENNNMLNALNLKEEGESARTAWESSSWAQKAIERTEGEVDGEGGNFWNYDWKEFDEMLTGEEGYEIITNVEELEELIGFNERITTIQVYNTKTSSWNTVGNNEFQLLDFNFVTPYDDFDRTDMENIYTGDMEYSQEVKFTYQISYQDETFVHTEILTISDKVIETPESIKVINLFKMFATWLSLPFNSDSFGSVSDFTYIFYSHLTIIGTSLFSTFIFYRFWKEFRGTGNKTRADKILLVILKIVIVSILLERAIDFFIVVWDLQAEIIEILSRSNLPGIQDQEFSLFSVSEISSKMEDWKTGAPLSILGEIVSGFLGLAAPILYFVFFGNVIRHVLIRYVTFIKDVIISPIILPTYIASDTGNSLAKKHLLTTGANILSALVMLVNSLLALVVASIMGGLLNEIYLNPEINLSGFAGTAFSLLPGIVSIIIPLTMMQIFKESSAYTDKKLGV